LIKDPRVSVEKIRRLSPVGQCHAPVLCQLRRVAECRPSAQNPFIPNFLAPDTTNLPSNLPAEIPVTTILFTGSAQIWLALEACGLPDILGVWNHEGGPATRFTVIQIKQRYPGHARNVLHVASNCQGGAYAGRWTVVVDEDIDAGDLDQVLWAMCTRFDPAVDIDLIQKAWASKRDPLVLPGNFNNRVLIDACIPYDMKLKGKFPRVVDVSPELRAKIRSKFSEIRFPET
jgi:4-hydroxy-3-polyprenylbenzoate decarboxylase